MEQFAKRPDTGRNGQPVAVRTNMFEVKSIMTTPIFHYDATVTPEVPSPVRKRVFEHFVRLFGATDLGGVRPIYDGMRNMFTNRELPFASRTFEVVLPSDAQRRIPPGFKLKVRKVASIETKDLHQFLDGRTGSSNSVLATIMVIDVLVRYKPSLLYTTVGRSIFTPEGKLMLSGPVEVWRGFYQSARPTISGMMINVDTSASTFFQPGPLLHLAIKILNLRNQDDLRRVPLLEWRKVEKTIRGLRIQTRHREGSGQSFKIRGLTPTSAAQTTITIRAGANDEEPTEVETTVEGYFAQTYGIRLQFPMLPCAMVGKSCKVPLEVCQVLEAQRYTKRLDERQVSEMIKFTCQAPTIRVNIIKQGFQTLGYDDNEYLKDFGVTVSSEMKVTKGRYLKAPDIFYHPTSREPRAVPRDGHWNLVGKKLISGATLGSWGVIVYGSERDIPTSCVEDFIRGLIVICTQTGMNIINKRPPITYQNPHGVIEQGIRTAWLKAGDAVKSKPQLLVCILPNRGTSLYAEIKRATDTVFGVASQCVQSKHIRSVKPQYCANLSLKMNVKLGGCNSQLAPDMLPVLKTKPTIVLGADVHHPGAGDTQRPSIAALVGSLDLRASRYAATIRVQASRAEIIADLSTMTVDLLKSFYQCCGQKPERIIFYRDGVSEGQFAEVLQYEVAAVKAGCKRLEPGYNPQLTFIIVQRRHHTRFFPIRTHEGDRSGNCKSGLVVDTDIVHPHVYDFYLQSHGGLQGTSRPAHYFVLCDEIGLTPDDLQNFTFRLCHLQARCTAAVSMVPPAYYAHLVARRARFHSKNEHWTDSGSTEDSGAGDVSSYAAVKTELTRVMWFM